MKRTQFYFLLSMCVAICSGCAKQSVTAPVGVIDPTIQGNFIGQFTLIHKNSKTGVLDTASAIITLSLSVANGFSVSGDTTTIQYPSHGTYSTADDGTITFVDATVSKSTNINTPKKHLNGTFLYQYTAPNFVIYGSSDTLSYNYTLKSL